MALPSSAFKIARFLIVGGTVMLVFMGLNWLFGRYVGKQAAFLLAYPPALTVHFLFNKWWTFGDRRAIRRRQLGEYAAVVAVTFVVQWAVFSALTAWTPLPNWVAAGIANLAQVGLSYLGLSRRIFTPAPGETA